MTPIAVLGGAVWLFKSWRLAAQFVTSDGVYYWFHDLNDASDGTEEILAIETWCRQHQIDCLNMR